MNRDYLTNLNHDLSFRPGIIKEALEKGVQFGSNEFFVYSQLRWYETDGKFGFCVAGNERLAEDTGLTEKEVEHALRGLKDCGLIEHIWCDKKIYRNKTKLWISIVRLSNVCTNIDAIKVLNKGKKNKSFLGKTTSGDEETTSGDEETTSGDEETTSGDEGRSPVKTGVGNTNRNTKRNIENAYASSAVADSASATSPFSFAVNKQEEDLAGTAIDLSTRKTTKELFAFTNKLVELVGSPIKGKKTVLKKCVEARLSDGYSKLELEEVARWAATQSNQFYKSPYKLFSETGFNNALVEMKQSKPTNNFDRRTL